MQNIETSIIIEAPTNKVWSVLSNFNNYPEWNPFITLVKGDVKQGNLIEVQLEQPNGGKHNFKPEVLKLERNKEFRWKGKLFVTGLFDGEHYFMLEELAKNQTRLIHGEIFSGLLVEPLLALIKANTLKGFEAMNSALKTKLEGV